MRLVLAILLVAAFIGGQAASQAFPDVPPDHWAEEAVAEIAELGIVIGFPDDTFRGNEPFTRYQAALVISRVLALIDTNMERELGGVRATLLSMTADLAARAERLDAVEGAVAALSDEVRANRERIDALAAALAAYELPDEGVIEALEAEARAAAERADEAFALADEAVAAVAANAAAIEVLLAQMRAAAERADAAAAAAQEAATVAEAAGASAAASLDRAEAAAAAARDSAARTEGAFADAAAAVIQADAADLRAAEALELAQGALERGTVHAADVAALERMIALLGARVDRIELARSPEALGAMLDDAAGDVSDIREFVERLREELEELRERIEELEDLGDVAPAALEGLEDRVAALERGALQFSGSIALRYDVVRFADCEEMCGFDVDRVYGLGFRRDMGPSFLTTGVLTDPDYPRERRMEFSAEPGFTALLTLRVAAGDAFDAVSHPRGLDAFSAVADLDFRRATNLEGPEGEPFEGYALTVRTLTTTFEPIGAEPLVFRFGEDITVRATPFVFVIDEEPGFLAQIGAVGWLPFLSPRLWVAYTDPAAAEDAATAATEHRSALRLSLSPQLGDAVGLDAGFTFARSKVGTLDKDDVLDDDEQTTVWGIDGEARLLDVVRLEFEYASNPGDATSVVYVRAHLDGAGLPILRGLVADYRRIDPDWYGIWTDLEETEGRFPYALDQDGFGIEGSLRLLVLDISAFFDRYDVRTVDPVDTVTAFGLHAGLALPIGVVLEGWFESVAFDGVTVDATGIATREALGFRLKDGEYETQIGVRVRHDAAAERALVDWLDAAVLYRRFNADLSGQEVGLSAAFDLRFAPVALRPYLELRSYDDRRSPREQYRETVAGLTAQTATFSLGPLRPSFMAVANQRGTTYGTEHAAGAFTATELQLSFGVVLDEFLFGEYSTFSGRFGRYAGRNVDTFASALATDPVPGVGRDWDDPEAGTTSTAGFELRWNYFDLQLTYGSYRTTGPEASRSAEQFRVEYRVVL